MMKGPDPARSIEIILDFGIYLMVFIPPETCDIDPESPETSLVVCRVLQQLISSEFLSKIRWLTHPLTKENIAHLYLAAALSPFRNCNYKQKARILPAVKHIVGTSLKVLLTDLAQFV